MCFSNKLIFVFILIFTLFSFTVLYYLWIKTTIPPHSMDVWFNPNSAKLATNGPNIRLFFKTYYQFSIHLDLLYWNWNKKNWQFCCMVQILHSFWQLLDLCKTGVRCALSLSADLLHTSIYRSSKTHLITWCHPATLMLPLLTHSVTQGW